MKKITVNVNTGTAFSYPVTVEADHLQDAIDQVADHIEKEGLSGLYKTYDEFVEEAREHIPSYRSQAELEDEAERLIEASSYVCAGNYGIYLIIDSFEGEE